jgi:hypothetical protein
MGSLFRVSDCIRVSEFRKCLFADWKDKLPFSDPGLPAIRSFQLDTESIVRLDV